MPPRRDILNPPIPALHPERDALLAAVRDAHPDDDLPALVYADWQDEHGQPEHAELIRVMVELVKVPKGQRELKERRAKLLARTKELFKTPALKPLQKLAVNAWGYERGFAHSPTLHLIDPADSPGYGWWVHPAQLPNLATRVPFDKLLGLGLALPRNPTTEHAATIAAVPWLKRVDHLEHSHPHSERLHPGTLAPLVACKNLGGLRSFRFYSCIAGSELLALYLAKSATKLREFHLRAAQCLVTPDNSSRSSRTVFHTVLERIVSEPRAKQFTSFGDEVAEVDEPLAKILLASPYLKNIREFRYVFEKSTPKTQATFIERFGKPERV